MNNRGKRAKRLCRDGCRLLSKPNVTRGGKGILPSLHTLSVKALEVGVVDNCQGLLDWGLDILTERFRSLIRV